jgi:hypothetical protein
MSLPRFAELAVIAVGLCAVVNAPIYASPPTSRPAGQASEMRDGRPANCRVTLPSDGRFTPPAPFAADPDDSGGAFGFWFGSEKLWTHLPVDGTWLRLKPYFPGDSNYRQKIFWYSAHPVSKGFSHGMLAGRRLDGPATPFESTFPMHGINSDNNSVMAVSGVDLPTAGCWEITGTYGSEKVTFVVWVTGAEGSAAMPSDRVRLDGTVEAQKLINKTDPEIPPDAKRANVSSGTVVFRAIIAKDGSVESLSYISGPPLLMNRAMDAAENWRYKPTIINGQAMEVDTTIEVPFAPRPDR